MQEPPATAPPRQHNLGPRPLPCLTRLHGPPYSSPPHLASHLPQLGKPWHNPHSLVPPTLLGAPHTPVPPVPCPCLSLKDLGITHTPWRPPYSCAPRALPPPQPERPWRPAPKGGACPDSWTEGAVRCPAGRPLRRRA
eukprot:362011-Chlamydomonas_euryale.AAC.8